MQKDTYTQHAATFDGLLSSARFPRRAGMRASKLSLPAACNAAGGRGARRRQPSLTLTRQADFMASGTGCACLTVLWRRSARPAASTKVVARKISGSPRHGRRLLFWKLCLPRCSRAVQVVTICRRCSPLMRINLLMLNARFSRRFCHSGSSCWSSQISRVFSQQNCTPWSSTRLECVTDLN